MESPLSKEIQAARQLVPILRHHPWIVPAIVLIGVLASLAEGFGISLFIPFLNSFDQLGGEPPGARSTGSRLVDFLEGLFAGIAPEHRFALIAGFVFACILLKVSLTYANTVLLKWLEARVGHQLRTGIFGQLLTIGYRYFERNDMGRTMNTLSTETWRTGEALANFVGLLTTACTVAVYTTLLLLISWKLTLLVLAGMVLVSSVLMWITRRAKHLGRAVTETNSILAQRMVEGVEGMRVIRAFGREQCEEERFSSASGAVSKALLRLQCISGAVHPAYEALASGLLVGILLTSLQYPQNLASILVFIFVLYRLQPRLMSLESARVALISDSAAVEEVNRLLNRPDKGCVASGNREIAGPIHEISFHDVTFRYHPLDRPALERVHATIRGGATTAIVGPSGAGKSTFIHLLLRFYDPVEGEIRINGIPLRELAVNGWRRRVAVVPQEVFLFNTTIRENIAYGNPEASDEEIINAARLAHADEFIRHLPRGYESYVGDRGLRLSGGEKQRITLARAILRNPDILILDEATNSLDTISERLIQTALEELSTGRTVIVIAHRLSTIEKADHVIVLEGGRVKEEGSLPVLLARNGLFSRLYTLHSGAQAPPRVHR